MRKDLRTKLRRSWPFLAAVLALAGTASLLIAREPSLDQTATSEGELVIYSATDESEFAELLSEFGKSHRGISVNYESLPAREVYERYRAEELRGGSRADMLINSAMDLQIKLVNDGFAVSYASPEASAIPDWAIWKNQAFAISTEPIVIGYNPKLLSGPLVPQTHDDLAGLLYGRPGVFEGKVGLYDPQKSPTGYLYISQDVRNDSDAWELIAAIGRTRPKLFLSTQEMLDQVSSGQLLLAYNVIGSYAFERAREDSNFAVLVPRDYVLMMSRVALISRNAPHPAAAKLFLDFLLSKRGQAILSRHHMTPLRDDVTASPNALADANVRAVRVGPALMAGLDKLTLESFTRKWNAAILSGHI
jgi:iron(III) transport system substrate-binding protein